MLESYWPSLYGVIDKCKDCDDNVVYKKTKDGFIIECPSCGQFFGPDKDEHKLGWDWNKEQRKDE